MTKEEFQIWADVARQFRDDVMNGKMDLAEYADWLKR